MQSGSNANDPPASNRRREREGELDSPHTATRRRRLAGATQVSHADGTGANIARHMRRLFSHPADTSTDDPIEEEDGGDNDDEGDEPYVEEEPVVPLAAAATRQVQEPVQYGTNTLTPVGRDWLLEKCVKKDVFPKIKFANLDHELAFSNDLDSICRFMAGKMKVQDANVERWWMGAKKGVHKKLKTNRNNVIKAIKNRFHGKSEMNGWMLQCYVLPNTLFLFTTDNILEVTNQEFRLESITGMRSIASRAAYIELLDCLARSVVGRKVYMDNRMTKPLSEWFSYTDEAFLLVCLESYVPKWNRAWARRQREGGQQQNAAAAEDEEQDEDARYTGKAKGTKLGWTDEGKERMNALMIDVARDRQANGPHFDIIFKDEMIRRYTKEDTGGNVHEEEVAPQDRVVIVYNDFNIAQLLAHAAMDPAGAEEVAGEAEDADVVNDRVAL
jgi:hypothetical protein